MSITAYLTKKAAIGLAVPAVLAGTVHLTALGGDYYSRTVFDGEARLAAHAANTWRGFQDDVAAAHGYERNPDALTRPEIEALVEAVAAEGGVEAPLLKAIVLNESNFNSDALSRAGAIGLGQVMPFHVKTCGYSSTKQLLAPRANLACAAKILKRNLTAAGGNRESALSLYNWGRVPTKGSPMPAETRAYVANVMRDYKRLKA